MGCFPQDVDEAPPEATKSVHIRSEYHRVQRGEERTHTFGCSSSQSYIACWRSLSFEKHRRCVAVVGVLLRTRGCGREKRATAATDCMSELQERQRERRVSAEKPIPPSANLSSLSSLESACDIPGSMARLFTTIHGFGTIFMKM